jgi:hypothetical protein
MKRTLATVIFAGAAALALSCAGRAHLTNDFGDRSREHFAQQHVNPEPSTDTPAGLDSEEAEIIHGEYRKNLGATQKSASRSGARVLVVEPDR